MENNIDISKYNGRCFKSEDISKCVTKYFYVDEATNVAAPDMILINGACITESENSKGTTKTYTFIDEDVYMPFKDLKEIDITEFYNVLKTLEVRVQNLSEYLQISKFTSED